MRQFGIAYSSERESVTDKVVKPEFMNRTQSRIAGRNAVSLIAFSGLPGLFNHCSFPPTER